MEEQTLFSTEEDCLRFRGNHFQPRCRTSHLTTHLKCYHQWQKIRRERRPRGVLFIDIAWFTQISLIFNATKIHSLSKKWGICLFVKADSSKELRSYLSGRKIYDEWNILFRSRRGSKEGDKDKASNGDSIVWWLSPFTRLTLHISHALSHCLTG